ncbi:ABC transporter permease [Brevibacillus sp. B_LB10_24]|uniref:ABC transporter permease n=1 Tax=Brevibacillus sp. B_LB10_24 TaxID=3380645 RepID=UPI0038BBF066
MIEFFTNPLIVKEMRERFRSKKTVWILALYLFVMGAILLGFIYVTQINEPYSILMPGENRKVFLLMAVIQFGMICFIAPALSAGAISGERERQTLNILLATQLSPARIIVSKLLTSLAFIFLLIVASLPLYSFVFLYGGVSPAQLCVLVLFFAITILFFGSLGLFCSTWTKRTGVSTILSYGLSFFFVAGTGVILFFLISLLQEANRPEYTTEYVWNLPAVQLFAGLNPVITMFDILGRPIEPAIQFFITPWVYYAIVYTVLSGILIACSCYMLQPVRRPLRLGRRRP